MPSLSALRRRDPWWEADGTAACRERRRQRVISSAAFAASLAAVGGAAIAWALQLGVARALQSGSGLIG
jgi:uncharacterized membrane protein